VIASTKVIYSEALPRDTDTSGYTHSSLVANLAPSDSPDRKPR